MTPEEMRTRLATAPVGRLATLDPDGSPNVVPFVFALIGDTLYSTVDAKPKRSTRLQRLVNLERDPRATILADHYEDDWGRLWWVRVRGTGRRVDDAGEAARAVTALRAMYSQYARTDPGEIVFAIDLAAWRGWAWED